MRRTHILLGMFALTLLAGNAWAQGFGVYEQSACALGRGGATVAMPCNDGSAIFFNPAGLGLATGTQISVGGSIINPNGDFRNATTQTVGSLQQRYYQVPNAYIAQPIDKFVVGFGMFAPYGLTTDWPLNFEGRFLGYKTSVKGLYLQPTVAYKVTDNVSIGAGVDITYASLELNQRVDLSTQQLTPAMTFAAIGIPAGTDFANVKLSGNRWKIGFNAGVQAKLPNGVSFGARYLARQKIDIADGDFAAYQIPTNLLLPITLSPTLPKGTPIDMMVRPQFTGQGALAVQRASTAITFPDQLVVGTAFKVASKTTILADYIFTHWALFDQIVITRQYVTTPTVMTENYRNTHGVRLGVEHEVNSHLALRGGFVTHTAAAPDETVTPLLPEGPRKEFSGGLGLAIAKNLRADLYYMYLLQPDRSGRSQLGANNGTYSFMSNLFGLTLSLEVGSSGRTGAVQ